jgi:DNA topoisomerase VI subunit A
MSEAEIEAVTGVVNTVIVVETGAVTAAIIDKRSTSGLPSP